MASKNVELTASFETPYTQTGIIGFWIVIGTLGAFIGIAIGLARRRGWI